MKTLRKAAMCMAIGATLSLTVSAQAAPMEIGVGVHFGHNKGNLALTQDFLKESGLQSIRDDVGWGMVENSAGVLALNDGALNLKKAMLQLPTATRPMYIFDYGHIRYDGGGQPSTPAGVNAYARFVRTILPQMPMAKSAYVEIWNEWNIGSGSKPVVRTGSPEGYAALVKATAPVIKSAAPGAKVIVGALGDDFPDWQFAKSIMKLGALDQADGLSVHIYNYCAGKGGSDEAISRIDALRNHMVAAGKGSVPILVTELGWPNNTGKCGIAENDGALYMLRFLLEASTRNWLSGVWLYELLDSGTDAADRENRFGAMRLLPQIPNAKTALTVPTPIPTDVTKAATKPIGCVLKSVAKLIGTRPTMISNSSSLRAALYNDGGRRVVALWNVSTKPVLAPMGTLTITGGKGGAINPLAVCDVSGGSFTQKTSTATASSFGFTLQGGFPLLLELPATMAVSGIEVRE